MMGVLQVSGRHFWRFASNGQYNVKLAYEGFFWGQLALSPMKGFGRLGRLLNVASSLG
jgi:hypothetical protein